MDELVEESLRRAALWDEVKDKLKESGLALSGGQQQRLCIARAIATRPDVILMDEPCSSLDPIATSKIEDLMQELVSDYTIVIVTHNMQQAARVSDRTAFFTVDVTEEGHRTGTIVEFDRTETIFTNPGRRADGGVRDGEVRMTREGFHESLERIELELLTMGELTSTRGAARGPSARATATRSMAQAVIDADDPIDELLPEHRPLRARAARPAIAGRGGPSAGVGDPAQLSPSRADRRPGRQRRQALSGDEDRAGERDDASADRGDGRHRGGHGPHRDGGVRAARPRSLPEAPADGRPRRSIEPRTRTSRR